jgi:hypothetical protein
MDQDSILLESGNPNEKHKTLQMLAQQTWYDGFKPWNPHQ